MCVSLGTETRWPWRKAKGGAALQAHEPANTDDPWPDTSTSEAVVRTLVQPLRCRSRACGPLILSIGTIGLGRDVARTSDSSQLSITPPDFKFQLQQPEHAANHDDDELLFLMIDSRHQTTYGTSCFCAYQPEPTYSGCYQRHVINSASAPGSAPQSFITTRMFTGMTQTMMNRTPWERNNTQTRPQNHCISFSSSISSRCPVRPCHAQSLASSSPLQPNKIAIEELST